jgi:hypothetical protein
MHIHDSVQLLMNFNTVISNNLISDIRVESLLSAEL